MLNQIISQTIAQELNVQAKQILSAITLVDEGNTIPFIARYRKEVTGGLDDTQLRHFETRLLYLREMDERRQTILKSIADQGKLSAELQSKIEACQSKTELEDLICHTNRNVAPKGKLRLKPVWNRWQIYYGNSRRINRSK